jgi:hypothetical protein
MGTFYITSTIVCVLITALLYSIFLIKQPRLFDIIWCVALFVPLLNVALTAFCLILLTENYANMGEAGVEPRDTKWAKWLLNEE